MYVWYVIWYAYLASGTDVAGWRGILLDRVVPKDVEYPALNPKQSAGYFIDNHY